MRRWPSPSRSIICLATLALALAGASSVAPSADAADAGTISGTVTGVGGAPLSNFYVEAYQNGDDGWGRVTSSSGQDDGSYDLFLAPGTYRIRFVDRSGYLAEYYDDAATLTAAADITVPADGSVSGKDAELAVGGHITGTVTDHDGAPLQDVTVTAYRNDGDGWAYVRSTGSSSAGTYDLNGLPTGTYRIRFSDYLSRGYAPEYYDNSNGVSTATNIAVTAGATTSGMDAQIVDGGHITGIVTATGGEPLRSIQVEAYRNDGEGWASVGSTWTTDKGTYDLDQLPTGIYRIRFVDNLDLYATEFWDNASSVETAHDVAVAAGSTSSGKGAELSSASAPSVANTALPTVTGTPKVGTPLTAGTGSWNPPTGLAYTYRWLVGGTPVTGATAATYTPAAADVGKTLQVEVSATKDGYTAATATSAAKTITKGTLKATKKPKVTGKAKKNATLTVSPGTWSPQAKATYQWYAGSKAIAKATAAKLKLTGKTLKTAKGKAISVLLTITAPGYRTVTTRLKVPGKV